MTVEPLNEIGLWLRTGAGYFAAAGRIGARVALTLFRRYAPALRNRNVVAMYLAQGLVVLGLPIAAEQLDPWVTRIVFLASIGSALLFVPHAQDNPQAVGFMSASEANEKLAAMIEAHVTARLDHVRASAAPAKKGGRTFDDR